MIGKAQVKNKCVVVFVALAAIVFLSVGVLLSVGKKSKLTTKDQLPKPRWIDRNYNPRLVPSLYFSAAKDLEVCQAISDNNLIRLRDLLTDFPDINSTGKDGVTFLFWAWMVNNLEAFKILLDLGADPDATVKNELRLDLEIFARAGDSVLFGSLKFRRGGDFLDAALKYTRNPNQVDAGGYNLVHRYFSPGTSADGFNRIDSLIASGVDLHKPSPRGETVCEMAITAMIMRLCSSYECIRLLEAGAPTEYNGRSLYSSVEKGRDVEMVEIKSWLESHGYANNRG